MNEFKNIKILYIDDEENIRECAAEYLTFYSDYVYQAKDGEQGLKLYEEIKPDIIITDIKMPKLTGLQMVREIRKKDKETKIIMATAFLESKYLLEAVELGLVKYLIKPITEASLMPVLKICLEDLKEKNNVFKINSEFLYDMFNQVLFYKKEQVLLTKKELLLLNLLVKQYPYASSYESINQIVWAGEMTDSALRSVVKDLRNRISKTSIKNVSGLGYKLHIEEI